jgi:predicted AAA+ superfamily ATPase
VIQNVIILERYFKNLETVALGSGSNILITGVKGVGKTTLMNGLTQIIRAFADRRHVTAVFVDFEQNTLHETLPSKLLSFPTETSFNEQSLHQWSLQNKRGLNV